MPMPNIRTCSKTVLFAFIIIVIGALLAIMGIASLHWLNIRLPLSDKAQGLFEACDYMYNVCGKISKPQDWWVAVQAMMVIGVIFYMIVLVFTPLYFCGISCGPITHDIVNKVMLIGIFLAAIFMLIGLVIFTARAPTGRGTKFGWSYGVSWVSAIFAILAGTLLVCIRQKHITVVSV